MYYGKNVSAYKIYKKLSVLLYQYNNITDNSVKNVSAYIFCITVLVQSTKTVKNKVNILTKLTTYGIIMV